MNILHTAVQKKITALLNDIELKKSLFLKRFNKLLKSTRTDELTMDEITNEVESVRKQRYEKGTQAI